MMAQCCSVETCLDWNRLFFSVILIVLLKIKYLDTISCGIDDGCHENSTCTDGNGSYTCVCQNGFTGDGFNCTGEKKKIAGLKIYYYK